MSVSRSQQTVDFVTERWETIRVFVDRKFQDKRAEKYATECERDLGLAGLGGLMAAAVTMTHAICSVLAYLWTRNEEIKFMVRSSASAIQKAEIETRGAQYTSHATDLAATRAADASSPLNPQRGYGSRGDGEGADVSYGADAAEGRGPAAEPGAYQMSLLQADEDEVRDGTNVKGVDEADVDVDVEKGHSGATAPLEIGEDAAATSRVQRAESVDSSDSSVASIDGEHHAHAHKHHHDVDVDFENVRMLVSPPVKYAVKQLKHGHWHSCSRSTRDYWHMTGKVPVSLAARYSYHYHKVAMMRSFWCTIVTALALIGACVALITGLVHLENEAYCNVLVRKYVSGSYLTSHFVHHDAVLGKLLGPPRVLHSDTCSRPQFLHA